MVLIVRRMVGVFLGNGREVIESPEKGLDDAWIEVLTFAAFDDFERFFDRKSFLVMPPADQGIKYIGQGH